MRRQHPWCGLIIVLLSLVAARAQMTTQATTVPLILPGSLAYDAAGNLYFVETGRHVVRRVSPSGVITVIAGTGTQGLSGDGGPATSAMLDSPAALALDANGNLFIADTHNHRIRRVDASTGTITTIAGTGVAGASPDGTPALRAQLDLPAAMAFDSAGDLFFADRRTHQVRRIDRATGVIRTVAGSGIEGYSGDGGPATAAALDSPAGLAFDPEGNLYLSDTHNQRVREVLSSTGIILTVAGSGSNTFAGDGGPAATASLALPIGLAFDPSGNLLIADSGHQRLRLVTVGTGDISTVAGDGVQGYAGDSGAAALAMLDTPRAVALSPAALLTLADTGNARIRQVDTSAIIRTIAGLGAGAPGVLTLAAPSVVAYGATAMATATLASSPATGAVTFLDTTETTVETLAAVPLAGNASSLSTAALGAMTHRLQASYPGDPLHPAALSNALTLTVAPAPAVATPAAIALVFGQAIPALKGGLTGILPQDASTVLSLGTTASQGSLPGVYAITAALTGPGAANYSLTTVPANVQIAKAPAVVTLNSGLQAHVASSTTGVPGGVVSLLDGSTTLAVTTLNTTGDANFGVVLGDGPHTLTVVYAGDTDFLAGASAPTLSTVAPSGVPDFTLVAAGQTAQSVPTGTSASYSFQVTPVNGALASAVLLTTSGLPSHATASFNPAYLPPSASPTAFILTVSEPKAQLSLLSPVIFAVLLIPTLAAGKRRRKVAWATLTLCMTAGCGDRVNSSASSQATTTPYTITVTGTATQASGAVLQHTATVTLNLQ